jgi:hypothetical protein
MIDTESVRQALGSLERHAPTEDDVLYGVQRGIARRRRRRQVASVAGVAGIAALVGLGVVLLVPGRGGGDQAATPGARTVVTPAAPKPTPPAPPTLPFTVGWLPAGYTLDAWDVSAAAGNAQYVGTKDFQTVVVHLDAKPVEAPRSVPGGKGATDQPTTVAGRTGTLRKFAQGGEQQLIWQLADGRWAMVGGMAPTVPLDTLRRVAESLSLKPTPLPSTWGLRAVPEGYQVVGWNGGASIMGAMLCRGPAGDPRTSEPDADCVTVSEQNGTMPASVPRPIVSGTDEKKNPVQVPLGQEKAVNGVPTRVVDDGTLAAAQVDAGHWAQAFSKKAGADVLRDAVSNVIPK